MFSEDGGRKQEREGKGGKKEKNDLKNTQYVKCEQWLSIHGDRIIGKL